MSQPMTRGGRTALGLILAVLVLALDQASKQWVLTGLDLPQRGEVVVIPKLLDLAMAWNDGVTFGLLKSGGGWGPVILGGVALAVVAGLLLWLRRAETAWTAAALGAIAGGALGNVVDRARFGRVVDFIHVHWGAWDPFPFIFNGGDSAIVIGVGLLLLESLVPSRSLQPAPPKA
jgi:lipoprotein signal peptidase